MAHAGEPVGNAGALLRNLLQDSRSAVADDVVVALHLVAVAYTGPHLLAIARVSAASVSSRRRTASSAARTSPDARNADRSFRRDRSRRRTGGRCPAPSS